MPKRKSKGEKKETKAIYLAPIEIADQEIDIDYDPQTQVVDEFEVDLNLLLQKTTVCPKPQIYTKQNYKEQPTKAEQQVSTKQLSKKVKSEILDFDIDLSSSESDSDDLIESLNDSENSNVIESSFEEELDLSDLDLSDNFSIEDFLEEDEDILISSKQEQSETNVNRSFDQLKVKKYWDFLVVKKKDQLEDDLTIGKPVKARSKHRSKKPKGQPINPENEPINLKSSESAKKKSKSKSIKSRRIKQAEIALDQPAKEQPAKSKILSDTLEKPPQEKKKKKRKKKAKSDQNPSLESSSKNSEESQGKTNGNISQKKESRSSLKELVNSPEKAAELKTPRSRKSKVAKRSINTKGIEGKKENRKSLQNSSNLHDLNTQPKPEIFETSNQKKKPDII